MNMSVCCDLKATPIICTQHAHDHEMAVSASYNGFQPL